MKRIFYILAVTMLLLSLDASAQCNAGFSFTQSNDTLTFTDTSSSQSATITSWSWSFGDTNTSALQHPVHSFGHCGMYIVTLTIGTSDACTDSFTDTVYVSGALNAAFSAATMPGNLNAQFLSDTFPAFITHHWTFGDGDTSVVVSPAHTYGDTGVYSVCHIVTDTNGICIADTSCSLLTIYSACAASFSYSVSGDTVSFTDLSSAPGDTISSWTYLIDGFAITIPNPVSTLPCGEYIVTESITTNSGCTSSFTDTILVVTSLDASYTYTSDSLGNAALFASPADTAYTYNWNLGDGNTASGDTVIHTYSASATYYACLMISSTNAYCLADTVCDSIAVNIAPPQPCQAAFTYSVNGNIVTFTNTSTAPGDSITNTFWNFGDFTTSAQYNPVKTYNGCGVYIVTLNIFTANGCNSTVTDTITINGQVNGNFTYFVDTLTGQTQFFGTPNNASHSFAWDFGDGNTGTGANPTHTYVTGSYIACVVISSSSNACIADTVCDFIVVQVDSAVCNVSWTNIANGTFQIFTADPFDPTANFYWDFGDGSQDTGLFVTHTYPGPGTYTACVTVVTAQGCTAQFCDTVDIDACSISFTYSGSNGNLTFNATTTGGGIFPIVVWIFQDGTTATGNTVTHQFTSNGFQLVCAALNPPPIPGCADTTCQLIFVTGVIGIEENALHQSLSIYPNPANEILNLSFNTNSQSDVTLEVLDIAGNLVQSEKSESTVGANTLDLTIKELSAGIYFVRIRAGDQSAMRKFVKQ